MLAPVGGIICLSNGSVLPSDNFVIVKAFSRNITDEVTLVYNEKINLGDSSIYVFFYLYFLFIPFLFFFKHTIRSRIGEKEILQCLRKPQNIQWERCK